jgi:hypothetical protein
LRLCGTNSDFKDFNRKVRKDTAKITKEKLVQREKSALQIGKGAGEFPVKAGGHYTARVLQQC